MLENCQAEQTGTNQMGYAGTYGVPQPCPYCTCPYCGRIKYPYQYPYYPYQYPYYPYQQYPVWNAINSPNLGSTVTGTAYIN